MEENQNPIQMRQHPLYPQARLVILRSGRPSTSILQRQFRLGWQEAEHLLRAMEGDVVTVLNEHGIRAVRTALYIAGPSVFEPNAAEIGEGFKEVVRAAGFCPLYPMDNEIDVNHPCPAHGISSGNIELIKLSAVVVADLNPFRGPEPDSGTCWEAGFAAGAGKLVYGHVATNESLLERTLRMKGLQMSDSPVDRSGRNIENFGLPVNLMLAHGVERLIIGSFTDAVAQVADIFERRVKPCAAVAQ